MWSGGKYLKGAVLGLDVKEVDEDGLEGVPGDVEEVELPLDLSEADGRDVLIEEAGNVDPKVVDGHSLGTGLVIETLHGVQGLEGCESDGEGEAEEVDHGDGGVTASLVAAAGELGRQNGQEDEPQYKEAGRAEQHLAATNSVDETGTNDGADEGEDGDDTVEHELGVGVFDTSLSNHDGHEVGDCSISRPLCVLLVMCGDALEGR